MKHKRYNKHKRRSQRSHMVSRIYFAAVKNARPVPFGYWDRFCQSGAEKKGEMQMLWLGLLIGIFIGAFIGVALMCLLFYGR